MLHSNVYNALKMLLMQEIAGFACGFWREDSQRVTEDGNLGRLIQRIEMRMLR